MTGDAGRERRSNTAGIDTRDIDFNALRSLAMVVRYGGVPRAARALGSSASTVGRHLRYLEDLCGEELFDRTGNGLQINDRGRALADSAETLRVAADALLRALKSQRVDVKGALRVAASTICPAHVLSSAVAHLGQEFPALDVEIALLSHAEMVLEQAADLFVLSEPRPDLVEVASLPDLVLQLYGSAGVIDRFRPVVTAADLSGAAFVTPSDEAVIERLRAGLRVGDQEPHVVLMTDSLALRIDAARTGKALSLLDATDAAAYPDLMRVLADFAVRLPMTLAMRSDSGPNARAAMVHLSRMLAGGARS
jgi:DNA-binding transcriptional LysR family regulator